MNNVLQLAAMLLMLQRRELPEFTAGDQCLFCHRADIGPGWQKNSHNLTVRQKDGDFFTLGARGHQRELKKIGYGKFAIRESGGEWNATKFGDRCAGCHTTAVNAESRVFAEYAIDCYACHGVVNLEHSNDTSLILLSKKNRGDAKALNTICASCHLRGSRSKVTGLPYAYHYVPGDDLFVDWVGAAPASPQEAHVWRSVKDEASCVSCHQVHAGSTQKHRRVLTSESCLDCHFETGPKANLRKYPKSSPVCEY